MSAAGKNTHLYHPELCPLHKPPPLCPACRLLSHVVSMSRILRSASTAVAHLTAGSCPIALLLCYIVLLSRVSSAPRAGSSPMSFQTNFSHTFLLFEPSFPPGNQCDLSRSHLPVLHLTCKVVGCGLSSRAEPSSFIVSHAPAAYTTYPNIRFRTALVCTWALQHTHTLITRQRRK